MSMTTAVYESAMVDAGTSKMTFGGLSLASWQLVIWVLAGGVFIGVLLTVLIAFMSYRKNANRVLPMPTYAEDSLAMERERILSRNLREDNLEELYRAELSAKAEIKMRKEKLREMSLTQQNFLASKRAGRRPAIAGSSMVAEAGSRWWGGGSVRSGVSGVSTPDDSDVKSTGRRERKQRRQRRARGRPYTKPSSMVVEIGDYDGVSVRSGVSLIQTPMGSALDLRDSPV